MNLDQRLLAFVQGVGADIKALFANKADKSELAGKLDYEAWPGYANWILYKGIIGFGVGDPNNTIGYASIARGSATNAGNLELDNGNGTAYARLGGTLTANGRFSYVGTQALEFDKTPYVGVNIILTAATGARLGVANTFTAEQTMPSLVVNSMKIHASGTKNTAFGVNALPITTTSMNNTVIGYDAGSALLSGFGFNTFIGESAGSGLASGDGNVAIGTSALKTAANSTAYGNVAVGNGALGGGTITTSNGNIAFGNDAGVSLTTGNNNMLMGASAGYYLTTGAGNVFIGAQSGLSVSTGGGNTVIGGSMTGFAAGMSNTLVLGAGGRKDITADGTTLTFLKSPTIPDDAYAAGWDGNLTVPTKNAVYDKITSVETAIGLRVLSSTVGQANGVASLDGNGFVPANQLPSYVDDVIEAANLAGFPATGDSGKIYVAIDTAKPYRWSGSTYVEISASPGSTDAVSEGTTNLYHTVARVRATVMTGLADTTGTPAATDSLLTILGKIKKAFFTDHAGQGGAVHAAATTTVNGFMSSGDKSKLDGVAANATANTGTVTGVSGTAPIQSSGGTAPAISITAATTSAAGSMSSADKSKLDGIAANATANTGTVTGVTGTAPVVSSGGTAPAISVNDFNATTKGVVASPGTASNKYLRDDNTWQQDVRGIVFSIDGGGVDIVAGQRIDFEMPFAGTVTRWTIVADVAGSAVVDILRSTYANFPTMASISGTEKPTLSSAQKGQDTALTTWTTAIAAGDILRANVDSATSVKRLTVTLWITRT